MKCWGTTNPTRKPDRRGLPRDLRRLSLDRLSLDRLSLDRLIVPSWPERCNWIGRAGGVFLRQSVVVGPLRAFNHRTDGHSETDRRAPVRLAVDAH